MGIPVDEDLGAAKAAVKRAVLPWAQICDGKGIKGELAKAFHVQGVPASYLLDRGGRIAAKNFSGERLQRAVTQLLDSSTEAERERRLKVAEILQALEVKRGYSVAEVGAGSGFYVVRLAHAVGPSGRVYAVDLDETHAIPELRKTIEREGLSQVTVIPGEPANPRLPLGALDAVLIVNSYHEMSQHQDILRNVRSSLKQGGRLLIVDNMPRKTRGRPRSVQMKNHVLAPELAESEIRQQGFEILSRIDDFIDRPDEEESRWMIIGRRALE